MQDATHCHQSCMVCVCWMKQWTMQNSWTDWSAVWRVDSQKKCLRSGPGSPSTDICGHAQSRTWSIYAVMWPLTTVNMAVEPRLFLTVICNMLTAHSHTSQQLWFCMCCFVFSSETAARASAAEKVQDRMSAYGLFSYITHTLTLSHTHTTA